MMPAILEIPITSPLGALPAKIASRVLIDMRTCPPATAVRFVTAFSATSTIIASPRSFKCVSWASDGDPTGSEKFCMF